MQLSEKEWKEKLTLEQFRVLREKGTEASFTGKYVDFDEHGQYVCAACGNVLFDADMKFQSHCGWPSFDRARQDAVVFEDDTSHGMHRIEVLCKKCGGHLGHIFDDGPTSTGKRYCINSVALDFEGKDV